MPSNITSELCERIVATTFESLGAETVFKVKEAIGDGLSVGMAGCREQPPRILADYVRNAQGRPEASVWGHGFKTTTVSAALVNAASAHVLDYEPMSDPSTHAVSPVVPAVFALAEARNFAGRDIVTACAKGFEVQHRLLYAAMERDRSERRFHPPGVVGVMGSTAAAAHLLRLDAGQLASAFGIAASRAGSLLANSGTMAKCTHTGYAASGGLEAALLAERGFGGAPDIIEHSRGYVAAFFGSRFDYDKLLAYGEPYRIVQPGMAYKFFPSKYPTQFVITAALDLRQKVGDPARIGKVTITTPVMTDVDRPRPQRGLEGKFSFQYTAAAALLDGEVNAQSFSDERRFRSDMEALLPRITLVQKDDISPEFTKMHVAVDVETHDGARYESMCSTPRGFWGVSIQPEEHVRKMRDCMSGILNESEIADCAQRVAKLDVLEAVEVGRLAGLLGRKPGAD